MLFRAVIEERPGPGRSGVWAGFVVPANVAVSVAPPRPDGAVRKRVSVRGSVAGAPYRSSITRTPDGAYEFIASLDVRGRAGVQVGDEVAVEMMEDLDARIIDAPPDLEAEFEGEAALRDAWDDLPWSHRREFVLYLDDAKRPETRARRIERVAEALRTPRGAGTARVERD